LEQAASLAPDSSTAQLHLGEAYLGLDNDAKAMAAFDTAAKLSNATDTWNDIAYQLSRKKVHLDLARRYADSAVTSIEASLRNITLDHLRSRDFNLVRSLASYWDTLAWVEYADGHNDKALPYLLAAWQLNQDASNIAQHAAEVYETMGDRQSAIRFYALALNARRPEADLRQHLAGLLGGEKLADAKVHELAAEQEMQRSVTVDNSLKLEGKADFFVMLNIASGEPATVSGVRFISGDEKLKALTEAINGATFQQDAPGGVTFKLVRRGTLTCHTAAPTCQFLLWYPGDVRSEE
jgi:tetratricopeptide (TPR) repeat protein